MSKKGFLILIIVTTFVIMVWIIADILHANANVAILPQVEKALQPINPSFDRVTLDQIRRLNSDRSQ